MTGRVVYTPEAEQKLDHLDDWISEKASPEAARTFIRAVMDHCEGILLFPRRGTGGSRDLSPRTLDGPRIVGRRLSNSAD